MQLYTPSLRFYQETLRISLTLFQYLHDAVNSNTNIAEAAGRFPPISPLALEICVADTFNAMGLLYFKLRRYDESVSTFNSSLMIREKLLGPYHRDVIITFYNLAMVRLEASDPRLAIYMYHEGLRRERVRLGNPYHPSLSSKLQCMAEIYSKLGELNDSSICFQQALEIECIVAIRLSSQAVVCGSRFDGHLASICRLLNVIGNIRLMQANIATAMECFVQAARSTARLVALGYPHIPLVVAGHVFCHLARSQPECAAVA
jgi:tetratricopeptide (TPR) repeat protein